MQPRTIRLVLGAGSLGLGAVLFLGFRTPDQLAVAAADRQALLLAAAATTAPSPTPEPSASTAPGRGGVIGTAPTLTPTPTPVAGLGGAGLPPGATVYTGPVVSTRFGPVQVQIAALNGSIVEVVATELPVGGRSGSISRYAGPILQREAMAAGTAAIDFVSGATYTSRAYQQSLQAAIDKLRA